MSKTFSLACSVVLLSTLVGCAADVAPLGTGDHGPAPEAKQTNAALQTFEVRLRGETTAETVIPAILAAGHDQLAAACRTRLDEAVRVVNPLASGAYVDVPCSTLLDGDNATEEASTASTSEPEDGPLGRAQQKWSPFGLACGLFVGAAGMFANHMLCNYPGAQQPEACRKLTEYGFFGLSIACAFL